MSESNFDHPIRKGAVLERRHEEESIAKITFITRRLLDIDGRQYRYELVDYSNTERWTYLEDDMDHVFIDTGHTSTDTKIYKGVQPGLYEALKQKYGELR
jgi:hypothetical protein